MEDGNLRKEILTTYYKTILYQDIIQRFNIKKPRELETLFNYLISNCGSQFSYNSLKKFLDIDDKTIKEYILYLEDVFLVYNLNKFDFSLKSQIKSNKKIYSVDTGFMRNISFQFLEKVASLYENIVYLNLDFENRDIFYFISKNGYECDFVVKEGLNIVSAIQVCKNLDDEKTKKREVRGLVEALKELNLETGLILTEDEEYEFEERGFKIVVKPIWKWILGTKIK
jgi:uncharacterized protein